MAHNGFLIAIVLAAIAAPAFATDYIVGDDAGWRLGVDYTAWAEGKQFYVGDRLIFNYGQGLHNVYKVNGTLFQQCTRPSDAAPLTSGNDIVTLATPGRKWYICGVGNHCNSGMKFVITVWTPEAPSPAPIPSIAVPVSGTDYVVGDDAGWRLGVNYTAWAEGKQFFVGDRLIFNYGKGAHNVYKVNGTLFQQCTTPSDAAPLTSGNDVVTLATPGRKWYICGVGSHCTSGMKFVITVWTPEAPTPAPLPASEVSGSKLKSPFSYGGLVLVILSVLLITLV